MRKSAEILYEIIFRDHKSGILTSRIGRIDNTQIAKFSTNSNHFIEFKDSYNSPILKLDIQKIIIHHNDKKIPIEKEDFIFSKYLKSQKTGEIS
jgi:hypothetical protein